MGAMVIRVTPDGAVDRRIRVPVEKPTMPAFGGPDRATLFITTIGGGGSHAVDPSQASPADCSPSTWVSAGCPRRRSRVAHRSRRHDGDDPAAGVVRTPGDPRPRRDGRGGLHGPRAGDRGRSVLGRGDGCGRRRRSGAVRRGRDGPRPSPRGHRADRDRLRRSRRGRGHPARHRGLQHTRRADRLDRRARHADAARRQEGEGCRGRPPAGTAGGYYSRHHGIELDGKVLGLVGFGRIARHVARVADGLGMHVMFFDPYLPVSAVADGIERAGSLEALLRPRTWSRSTSR